MQFYYLITGYVGATDTHLTMNGRIIAGRGETTEALSGRIQERLAAAMGYPISRVAIVAFLLTPNRIAD